MNFNWQRKEYETRQQKTVDFVLGIAIFLVVNVLFAGGFVLFTGLSTSTNPVDNQVLSTLAGIGVIVCAVGPLIIDVVGIVMLAIYRRWMAFGMLTTIAAMFVVVVCLGVILIGACGAALNGGNL